MSDFGQPTDGKNRSMSFIGGRTYGQLRDSEEEIVPAGGLDAGAIAAGIGEAAVGPGDPGGTDLHFRQALKQVGVLFGGGHGGERSEEHTSELQSRFGI